MNYRAANLDVAPEPALPPARSFVPSSSGYQMKPLLRRLFEMLDAKQVRYCHWKSNMRLAEALSGDEDVDLLVDRRHASAFHSILTEIGFKMAGSRAGIGHPGVFHVLALDENGGGLLHLHVYFQIVSGDSLVKNYRFAIEDALLDQTQIWNGVRIPTAEAELVIFALRVALKHVSLIEILLARRDAARMADEMMWLRGSARTQVSTRLCAEWFPELDTALLWKVVASFSDSKAKPWTLILLGRRVARALKGRRRYRSMQALFCRFRHVAALFLGRIKRRRDFVLQNGGMIVALVGPKATGKSTLTSAIAGHFSRQLDVVRFHVGKPPSTALTWTAHMLVPVARRLYPRETSGAYESDQRRQQKRYSLLFVLRMALLAYDRRALLRRAQRVSAGGGLAICDRYPAATIGAIDSSCFDDVAIRTCGSRVKRWLMLWERSIYRSLPRAGLVVRLIAPIETTLARDAARIKQGGPNSEAVRRRWTLERSGEFSANIVSIETNQPLNETVNSVIKAVWSAL